MPYKDPAAQRAAVRKAVAKLRAKGITQGITGQQGITENVMPDVIPVRPPTAQERAGHGQRLVGVIDELIRAVPVDSEPALVSPSIPEHKRRRGGLKMGFEPNRTDVLTAPELDADNNPIPED